MDYLKLRGPARYKVQAKLDGKPLDCILTGVADRHGRAREKHALEIGDQVSLASVHGFKTGIVTWISNREVGVEFPHDIPREIFQKPLLLTSPIRDNAGMRAFREFRRRVTSTPLSS